MLWKRVYFPKNINADLCAIVRVGDIESKDLSSREKGRGRKVRGMFGVSPRQVWVKEYCMNRIRIVGYRAVYDAHIILEGRVCVRKRNLIF